MDVQTIAKCVRIMEHKGEMIHYTSGVTENGVSVSAGDCFEILKNLESKQIGYVVDMYDMMNMLVKSGSISKALYVSMMEEKIVFDLENFYVPIEDMITVCKYYKAYSFSAFLRDAKVQINDLGLYVGKISFDINDTRECTDKNLSNFLDMEALASYADLNNLYEDEVYLEVCNAISHIVFGEDIEFVRRDLNLYYEDYLCNNIQQKEYDEICFLCKVISYMMKYCDISMDGMKIFGQIALKSIDDSYEEIVPRFKDDAIDDFYEGLKKKTGRKKTSQDEEQYEDEEEPYHEPIKKGKNKKKEVEESKKYL